MKTTARFAVSKALVTYALLLALMVIGLTTTGIVLITHGRVPLVNVGQSVIVGKGQSMTLPVISTDNPPASLSAISDGGTDASKRITGAVQIPDPNSRITVVVAGAVWAGHRAIKSS